MEHIINFISNNYIWFIIITIILVLALIGYLVDIKKDKSMVISSGEMIDEDALKEKVNKVENVGLSEMVNKNMIHSDNNNENKIENINENNNSSV